MVTVGFRPIEKIFKILPRLNDFTVARKWLQIDVS
jgi:hypothetical protein